MAIPASPQVTISVKPIVKKQTKEPLWLGGVAASMAACFTHPLDQTKYRMQVVSSRVSLIRAVYSFAARDGILSLWQGLSASILRQSTYSTTRFALYNHFLRTLPSVWSTPTTGSAPTAQMTIACAGIAGGIAGLVGNPAEIVLVRMSADGAKPPAERYNYRHCIDGLIRVGREDGVAAYFRGLGPNIVRSVLMNISQIGAYTEAKRRMMQQLKLKDGLGTHVLASFVAGTVATTVCCPADVLKSRFQNASTKEKTSIVRYVGATIAKEGPGFLMKGWTPAWLRLAPTTVLTFVFMEKLKALFV